LALPICVNLLLTEIYVASLSQVVYSVLNRTDEIQWDFPRKWACGAAAPGQNHSHSYQLVFDEEA
jgi:hypothetical protein